VQVTGNDTISLDVAKQALEHLAIDELGLDKNDRKFLEILIEKFGGGPVGLSTLSAATGEEVDTIADVYEPFLIRQGLIVRTPKGREATERGRGHLGKMSN
jgi:Holliday junction DNA helicase RuvB